MTLVHKPARMNNRRSLGRMVSRAAMLFASLMLPALAIEAKPTPPFLVDIFSHHETWRETVDLNGRWELRRDPENVGKDSGWHEGEGDFRDRMTVPGAPQAQGIGEPHHYQKTYFKDPFWIRRRFDLQELDTDHRVWLRIGGILPSAEIYLNGQFVGYTKSSRTQQRVDVTPYLKPGTSNLIAIKVCDFPEVRLDGLLEWNEGTQLWTGPYRPIRLEIAHRISILDGYIQPKLDASVAQVEVELTEPFEKPLRLQLQVKDGDRILGESIESIDVGIKTASSTLRIKDFVPWSPNSPKLYTLEMSLHSEVNNEPLDRAGLQFGMRQITTEGTKFLLNGSPLFIRSYGEDHYYPETLCPPAEKEWYLPRLKRASDYGFNAVKGCVETIPQDYLEACDETGILVLQEMPFGLSTLRENRHHIDPKFRDYYLEELAGLIKVSRNHPSVIAYSMSSELSFESQTQESFEFFSQDLVRRARSLAPHALHIDCTGYFNSEETPKGRRDTDFYASIHPKWSKEVLDESDMQTDEKHPMILHEYNWWSCYPDPEDRTKYQDAQLLPYWLDTLETSARKGAQSDIIPTYRKNSLWLQALARKDGVEYARRNPLVEGYILWLLVDFGHWSEGLLDDFWNPKNVSPEEFLKSNADTVILLQEEGDRCLQAGAHVEIPLVISHYGTETLENCVVRWSLAGGPIVGVGDTPIPRIPSGELTRAGVVALDIHPSKFAYKLDLEVSLHHQDSSKINSNHWSFWVFPEVGSGMEGLPSASDPTSSSMFYRLDESAGGPISSTAQVVVSSAVDRELAQFVEAGGDCLLLLDHPVLESMLDKTDDYGTFRPIPWNRGDSGNLGTVIQQHPALKNFPHEGLCDLQFLFMLKGRLPIQFDALLPYGAKPIIRNIDHYYSNRNLAFLMEFKVGKGRVLATSLGLREKFKDRIEGRYLWRCLMEYVSGTEFDPSCEIPADVFVSHFSGN